MKIAIESVGFLTGDAASETRLGELHPDAPGSIHAFPVRPAPADLRRRFRTPPERLARTDRLCQLSLVAVDDALADRPPPAAPVAVVHESGLATIGTNDAFFRKLLRRGPRGVDPKRFPYTSPNAAAGEVAIAHALRGPNLAVMPGGTGGLSALATAVGLLRHGRAASAVVVGADALSIASVAWGVATGLGIGPAGEGAVALVLVPDGRGPSIESVEERYAPDRARGVATSPADDALWDAGDLPGAVGLLAIARATVDRRPIAVEAAGHEGAVVRVSVSG